MTGTTAAATTRPRRGRGRLIVFLVILAVVAGVALYAVAGGGRAEANAATVSVVKSALEAQKAGGAFSVALDGEVLLPGDQVRSDGVGRGFLTFFDGSTIEVDPGAKVAITELSRGGDGSIVIRVEQTLGRSWVNVQRFANPNSRFEVKTPATTAVVRGTAFEIIVEADGTTTYRLRDGRLLVTAAGVQREFAEETQSTTRPGAEPGPAQPIPPGPNLRLTSTAGTGITVITPDALACGGGRADAPGCLPGSVVLRGVAAGTYAVLMTASTSVSASLTFEALFGNAVTSTASLTRAMSRGDLVRTTIAVSLDPSGRPTLGAPTPFESLSSLCGAEARGRVFAGGTVDERDAALRQYAAANPNQPAAIVFTEADVAVPAGAQGIQGAPVTLSDFKGTIDLGGVHLRASYSAGPLSGTAAADVVAGAQNGRLAVRLRSLDLGPVPGPIADQVRQRIEEGLASARVDLPLTVERVAFRAGCVAIIGTTR